MLKHVGGMVKKENKNIILLAQNVDKAIIV